MRREINRFATGSTSEWNHSKCCQKCNRLFVFSPASLGLRLGRAGARTQTETAAREQVFPSHSMVANELVRVCLSSSWLLLFAPHASALAVAVTSVTPFLPLAYA